MMNDNTPAAMLGIPMDGIPMDGKPLEAFLGGNMPPEPKPEPTLEEELEAGFAPLADRVETLAAKANALPKMIDSDESLGQAADVGKSGRKLLSDIDADRKAKKEPYLEAGRLVDAFYKVASERIDRVVKVIEARATDYQREVAAAARRAAEDLARKAREEEMKRAEAAQAAAEAGRLHHAAIHEDKADEAAERAAQAEAQARQSAADLTRVRSATGTVSSARTTWKAEIVDKAKLDLEALRPFLTVDQLQVALNGWVRTNAKGATVASVLAGARVFEDLQTRFR